MSKKTLLIFFFLLLPTIIIASFSSLRSAVAENFWRFIGSGTSPDRPTHIVKINTNITEETNSTSPVLNYTFNGPDVFYSAGAISSITDKSGNNNTGTANNLTAYPGRVGQGLKFNGTNSYIEPTTSINPIKSISFWIKSDSTTQSIMQLNATQNISIVSGTITTTGFSSTVFVDGVNTTTYPNDNDWHNITITTGTGINANDIDIGRISTNYYSGLLDEVVMHNRTLTNAEAGNVASFGRRKVVVRGEPLPYSDTILNTPGLVSYWQMDSGFVSGADVLDSKGINHGTKTGATLTTTDYVDGGGAGSFDGTGDYVSLPAGGGVANSFTMEAWFKSSSIATHQAITRWRPASGDANEIRFLLYNSKLNVLIIDSGGSVNSYKDYFGATTLQSDTWYYYAMTWDGTNLKIYLNGAEDTPYTKTTDGAVSMVDTIRNRNIAADQVGTSNFNGLLDEYAVYDTALSASTILEHCNAAGKITCGQ